MGVSYSKMDPKTLELLKKVEANSPAVKQLEETKRLSESMGKALELLQMQITKGEKSTGDLGELLFEIRDALDTISNQETPESPDYAGPVVSAVSKLEKALSASIKGIDTKPQVNVAAPNVQVDAPKIDLKGIEKVLKSDLPKAFNEAIANIPEAPEKDYTELFKEMLARLEEIDTGVRLKQQTPNTVKVTNPDGSAIGSVSGATTYKVKFDTSTTGIAYVGKAAIGTSTGAASWKITKVDSTSTSDGTITYAAAGAFTATWTNRASETYS